MPVQASATSQVPTAARQTVAALAKRFAGQAAVECEHVSAASQALAEARQVVVALAKASAGQVTADPEQTSAASHGPAAARQDAPATLGTLPTQTGAPVVHETAPFSQAFAVAQATPGMQLELHTPPTLQLPPVQTVPVDAKASVGQVASIPVQASATSHWPAAARHTKPAARRPSAGHAAVVPMHASATSPVPLAGFGQHCACA